MNLTPENFCYWLQGFMELGAPSGLSSVQVEAIRDHLNLVFNKVTPDCAATPITLAPSAATYPNFKCVECGWVGRADLPCENKECPTITNRWLFINRLPDNATLRPPTSPATSVRSEFASTVGSHTRND
jgi:rubredoxin